MKITLTDKGAIGPRQINRTICSYGRLQLNLTNGEYRVFMKNPKKKGFKKISFKDQFYWGSGRAAIGSLIDEFFNHESDAPEEWSLWYKKI